MRSQFKLALKILRRRKFFTLISLFGIALTMVVLVVGAAIVDEAFSTRRPQTRFDRLLVIVRVQRIGPEDRERTNPGYAFLHDHLLNLPGAELTSVATQLESTAIYQTGARVDVQLKRTDANYWRICDFRFLEGRALSVDEVDRGTPVAVVTSEVRQRLFDGAPAVGRSIELEGRRYRIVGVVPRPSLIGRYTFADVWVPFTTLQGDWRHGFAGSFEGYVLARTPGDRSRLQQEFAARMKSVKPDDTKLFNEVLASIDTPFEAVAHDLLDDPNARAMSSNAPALLRCLMALGVFLFMALPALNLITLNLSRIMERASEIGVRKAFGAPRRRLVLQFVFENVLLTLLGGGVSLLLAAVVLSWINRSAVIPGLQLAINPSVFVEGMLLSALFGVLSGGYPAWRMARLDPVTALRGGVN